MSSRDRRTRLRKRKLVERTHVSQNPPENESNQEISAKVTMLDTFLINFNSTTRSRKSHGQVVDQHLDPYLSYDK